MTQSRINHLELANRIASTIRETERSELLKVLERAKEKYNKNFSIWTPLAAVSSFFGHTRDSDLSLAEQAFKTPLTPRDVFIYLFNNGGWYPNSSLNPYIIEELLPGENLKDLQETDFNLVKSYALNFLSGAIALTSQAQLAPTPADTSAKVLNTLKVAKQGQGPSLMDELASKLQKRREAHQGNAEIKADETQKVGPSQGFLDIKNQLSGILKFRSPVQPSPIAPDPQAGVALSAPASPKA